MKVDIVADSISDAGIRLTTFELEYPRFIHSELLTHRLLSRNSMSSRAVPTSSALDIAPVKPVIWGKNCTGMSSREELPEENAENCKNIWNSAYKEIVTKVTELQKEGLHKQWTNRILEPFLPIRTVVTATEWENFFDLRCNSNTVQPEFVALAGIMWNELNESIPFDTKKDDWHLPYIDSEMREQYDLDTLLKISVSLCAQVSYRKQDFSIEKANKIWNMLLNDNDPHMSPFEHQATPMRYSNGSQFYGVDCKGISHLDRNGNLWSGNFKGWIQHRKLIEEQFE